VAIVVAAIGAVATFTVGFLNFRIQRRNSQLQKDQQDWQRRWQSDQQDWQKNQQGRQFELMLATQITDRFTNAINQLGSDKKAIRIGGVFALEQIARDSGPDRPNIAYALATFVRESQPAAAVRERSYVPMLKIRAPDVQAAVTVLCRSPLCDDRKDASNADLKRAGRLLDLSRTDLRRASLTGAHLEGVNLSEARLEGADLRHAKLRCAGLYGANLGRMDPNDSRWEYGADLSDADLTDANLQRVTGLKEAKVTEGTRGLPT
jgi:uncharacterized protein YjbI with pentapeptide repeats